MLFGIRGSETEESEIKEVYAQFGATVFLGQMLEMAIVAVLAYARSAGVPGREQLEEVVAENARSTLGTLVQALERDIPRANELHAVLSPALEARNRIVHRYFREIPLPRLATPERRLLAVQELQEAQATIAQAQAAVLQLLVAVAGDPRITIESLQAVAIERYNQIRNGERDD